MLNFLKARGYEEKLAFFAPAAPAEPETVALIHDPDYIKAVERLAASGGGMWDPDTVISPHSYQAALRAVSGAIKAMQVVLEGEVNNTFALLRPPGHHAEPRRAMGFCLFNNLALAVKIAQNEYNLERILVVDWDVHHGNGTQVVFYDDPCVLYFSVHQMPLYPGTGHTHEVGTGKGRGYTVNVPLPPGCGDIAYLTALETILKPIALAYSPQAVFISAGQDAHFADPLANMNVTTPGFMKIAQLVKEIAAQTCGEKMIACLEGGYNLKTVPYPVAGIINIFAEIGDHELTDPSRPPRDELSPVAQQAIENARQIQREFWPVL